jgi:chromosome partitioning protein
LEVILTVYALWNNKGGVGKSYLTFQIACEYARTHQNQRVLVVDLCPQANSSGMLLGGMVAGESHISRLSSATPRQTISGYIEDRISSPYVNPNTGANYLTQVRSVNQHAPNNLYLICGDDELEIQSNRVLGACNPGPTDAWRIVHTWISDLIEDVRLSWNQQNITVFVDCNPSFTIYTELAMCASDRLLIPFSADGSSKRSVRSVLSLLFGITRSPGGQVSSFFRNTQQFRMSRPQIYSYIGNRLTQMNYGSASAFRTVVNEIFGEVFTVWQSQPSLFYSHPSGTPSPTSRQTFRRMFEAEINDANTASVVSGALGIPICVLTAGHKYVGTRSIQVNQSQLDKQQPNIRNFVATIE